MPHFLISRTVGKEFNASLVEGSSPGSAATEYYFEAARLLLNVSIAFTFKVLMVTGDQFVGSSSRLPSSTASLVLYRSLQVRQLHPHFALALPNPTEAAGVPLRHPP